MKHTVMKSLFLVLIITALVIAGCTAPDEKSQTPSPSGNGSQEGGQGSTGSPDAGGSSQASGSGSAAPGKNPVAVVITDMGTMKFELFQDKAP
ncbi:hypothetical protein COY95_04585, partial [Candidatus Woesearchaeota archaeon CG_4_10_14_0_8_um_filter_47_5]